LHPSYSLVLPIVFPCAAYLLLIPSSPLQSLLFLCLRSRRRPRAIYAGKCPLCPAPAANKVAAARLGSDPPAISQASLDRDIVAAGVPFAADTPPFPFADRVPSLLAPPPWSPAALGPWHEQQVVELVVGPWAPAWCDTTEGVARCSRAMARTASGRAGSWPMGTGMVRHHRGPRGRRAVTAGGPRWCSEERDHAHSR
jgi:hypothetical protein